ncbi:MAG: hypothetical protein ACYDHA_09845 [Bellilinea sp.]
MQIRMWMGVKAWVSLITGLGFLLVPVSALVILGTETDAVGLALARFFGATMFLVGLVLWMTRTVHDAHFLRTLAGAVFVGDTVATIVAVRETLSGTINAVGWVVAALYLAFCLAFGYSLLRISEPVATP